MKIGFSKKEKNFKKSRSRLSPNIFWKISIFVVFIVVILSSFFGYYLFMKTTEEFVLEEVGVSGPADTIKKERIQKSLDYFSLREKKSNEILNFPAPVSDPSL